MEQKTTHREVVAEVDTADCRGVAGGDDDLLQRSEEMMGHVDTESATVVHQVVATSVVSSSMAAWNSK